MTPRAKPSTSQRGTDQQRGAHFLMRPDTRPGMQPQSMILTLSIGLVERSCGSANDTFANLNPGDTRSIDGYLCQLRATYERNLRRGEERGWGPGAALRSLL
jgi:hypothetical protein